MYSHLCLLRKNVALTHKVTKQTKKSLENDDHCHVCALLI